LERANNQTRIGGNFQKQRTSGENTVATVSIISNEGVLDSASAVLKVTANPPYNPRFGSNKQVDGEMPPRSGLMIRALTLS
jgi:hypothetical protein